MIDFLDVLIALNDFILTVPVAKATINRRLLLISPGLMENDLRTPDERFERFANRS